MKTHKDTKECAFVTCTFLTEKDIALSSSRDLYKLIIEEVKEHFEYTPDLGPNSLLLALCDTPLKCDADTTLTMQGIAALQSIIPVQATKSLTIPKAPEEQPKALNESPLEAPATETLPQLQCVYVTAPNTQEAHPVQKVPARMEDALISIAAVYNRPTLTDAVSSDWDVEIHESYSVITAYYQPQVEKDHAYNSDVFDVMSDEDTTLEVALCELPSDLFVDPLDDFETQDTFIPFWAEKTDNPFSYEPTYDLFSNVVALYTSTLSFISEMPIHLIEQPLHNMVSDDTIDVDTTSTFVTLDVVNLPESASTVVTSPTTCTIRMALVASNTETKKTNLITRSQQFFQKIYQELIAKSAVVQDLIESLGTEIPFYEQTFVAANDDATIHVQLPVIPNSEMREHKNWLSRQMTFHCPIVDVKTSFYIAQFDSPEEIAVLSMPLPSVTFIAEMSLVYSEREDVYANVIDDFLFDKEETFTTPQWQNTPHTTNEPTVFWYTSMELLTDAAHLHNTLSTRYNRRTRTLFPYLLHHLENQDLDLSHYTDGITFQMHATRAPSGSGYSVAVRIQADKTDNLIQRENRVFYVLDCSTSTDSARFNQFKQCILHSIKHLNRNTSYNIIGFDKTVQQQATHRLIPSKQSSKQSQEFLAKLKQSYRSSHKTLETILTTLKEASNERNEIFTVVLLSDGNCWKNPRYHRDSLQRLLEQNSDRFVLHTCAMSDQNNDQMLKLLSQCNRGKFLYSQKSAFFARKFSRFMQNVQKPLFTHVKISPLNPNNRAQFFNNGDISPLFYADSPYVAYGHVQSLEDLDLLFQGYDGERWVQVRTSVSPVLVDKEKRKIEREEALNKSLLHMQKFLMQNDAEELLEAKALLSPYFPHYTF